MDEYGSRWTMVTPFPFQNALTPSSLRTLEASFRILGGLNFAPPVFMPWTYMHSDSHNQIWPFDWTSRPWLFTWWFSSAYLTPFHNLRWIHQGTWSERHEQHKAVSKECPSLQNLKTVWLFLQLLTWGELAATAICVHTVLLLVGKRITKTQKRIEKSPYSWLRKTEKGQNFLGK